jgi:electron-transferring-flavoprotein dehydrogenase
MAETHEHSSECEPLPEREIMEFDVVIVGAGPAGLAAAIRLKQLATAADRELSVVVIEKGSEVGAHILSGAVIDPAALNQLLPDWLDQARELVTPVERDRFFYLGARRRIPIPNFVMPPFMSNHGNYIVSLGRLCRWLAEQAEALGVEIFPGFAATEVIRCEDGRVLGVASGDMGLGKDGKPKDTFQRGVELRGKYTLIAEGARGSLAKQLISQFGLADGREPQKYGIGIKELWCIDKARHQPGFVQHTIGWPLGNDTGGGSFLYHFGEDRVAVGFVVHLNYKNPYLSPFQEFQRFKTHPAIAPTFVGGQRLEYGARALTEGGLQSVPRLVFPGGALIGCAAGFMNVPRIKGSHNAIFSGMLAAEAVFSAIGEGREGDVLDGYESAFGSSPIVTDLRRVRNAKPILSRFGAVLGTMLSGADMWLNTLAPGFKYTLKHGKPDHACLEPAAGHRPVSYPKPDGVLTFDILSSVYLAGANHEEDQPCHLQLTDPGVPIRDNLPQYAEPAQRYCPANVYEVVTAADGTRRLQINAQNCVHCKTCDIKDPAQNITWTPPEGGGGPDYSNM